MTIDSWIALVALIFGVAGPTVACSVLLYTRVAKLELLIKLKMDTIGKQLDDLNQSQRDLWKQFGRLEGRVDGVEKSVAILGEHRRIKDQG